MTQENQNNELNNLFTYDLYGNLGRVKRLLNEILEEYEERKEEEEERKEDVDMLLYELTIHKITDEILYLTYGLHDSIKEQQIESVKSELKFLISQRFEHLGCDLACEIEIFSSAYMAYDSAMSEIIDFDKDIKQSEHYNTVLNFLVKTIYIRGYTGN